MTRNWTPQLEALAWQRFKRRLDVWQYAFDVGQVTEAEYDEWLQTHSGSLKDYGYSA
jgi:hypothetical protein